MFSRFIHVVTCVRNSFFLWLNNIPLYTHKSIHLWGTRGLFPSPIVSNAVVNTGVQVSVRVPAFNSFGYNLVVELLDNTVFLCLSFWGTAKLFHSSLHHFTLLPAMHKSSRFLHILTNTYLKIFYFVIIGIIIGVRCYLIVVLMCIS